ncbi:hypothetical protein ASPZODRAFT_149883 [Penicilliopsis zonata CBS 506.65]|uniref:Ribonucleases P/MRP subunit Pop8-like domain-containing protein n=1 Tax=Penicilliopsis zonata CBS 506.65 TaxID=1073090 RepID=A0A1L9SP48_9EURO|nr:hypothetical protein ASPZODRAFT_149883 [Penicilliopsis zonata CBS 506.65]OJJ48881.1 hypothetical protein ASPZODRAFT_149883 [Penicilliopsis zonata CBS 506.65]
MSKRKAETTPVVTFTSRNPPWTYLKLQLIQSSPVDPLTARTHLTSALSQFLGLTGTSIAIDILKIDSQNLVWVRVPREDAPGVVAAVSSWVGSSSGSSMSNNTNNNNNIAWRICGRGNFLGALVNGSGGDLFVP